MNERVMQFRIGMFVIVAGLVLTMMIVWFGESPSLFRDHVFVKVHYPEAPGVSEGIPVRKSGIRIGEVAAIDFDERPRPARRRARDPLARAEVQAQGGVGPAALPVADRRRGDRHPARARARGPCTTATSPATAPIIEGAVSPDPSKALAAATVAFEKAGDTLKSIEQAATGIAKMTKSAENLDEFLDTWQTTGKNMAAAAEGVDRFIKANEADFHPTLANLRETSQEAQRHVQPGDAGRAQGGRRPLSPRPRPGSTPGWPTSRRSSRTSARRRTSCRRPTSARPSSG